MKLSIDIIYLFRMLTRRLLPKVPLNLTNTFTKKASELLLENKPNHPWIILVVNEEMRLKIQAQVDKINQMTPLEKEHNIKNMLGSIVTGRSKSGSRGGSTQRKRSQQKGGAGIVALASLVVLGIATLWKYENANQTHIEHFGIRYELVPSESPIAMYISSDFDNHEFIKHIDLTKFKHAADIAKMTLSGKHLFDAAQIHFYICLMESTGMFTKKINSPLKLLSYSESSQTSKEIVKVNIKDIIPIPTSKSSFNAETFVDDVKEELIKGSADKIDKTRMDVIESWLNILKHHNNINNNENIDVGVVNYVLNVLDKKYSYMDESTKLQVTAVFTLQLYEHNKKNGLKISQEINSQLLETTQKVAKDTAASGNKEKLNYYIYLYICIYAVIYVIDYYVDFESRIWSKTIQDKSSPINGTAQTAIIPLPGMEGYDSPVDQSNDNKESLENRMEKVRIQWGNPQTNSVISPPTRGWANRDNPSNTINRASQHTKENIKADLGITRFGSTTKRAATPKKGK